jgi:hypothetical protein
LRGPSRTVEELVFEGDSLFFVLNGFCEFSNFLAVEEGIALFFAPIMCRLLALCRNPKGAQLSLLSLFGARQALSF